MTLYKNKRFVKTFVFFSVLITLCVFPCYSRGKNKKNSQKNDEVSEVQPIQAVVQETNQILKEEEIKRPVIKNAIKAFIIGGLICLFGQGLLWLFNDIFEIEKDTSNILMAMVLVFIASLLTGIGIFDKIGEFAGAGTIVPITGFANSLTSSALESKSEGIITGILTNMFKLAGAVIAAGIISAFIVGTVIYLIRM